SLHYRAPPRDLHSFPTRRSSDLTSQAIKPARMLARACTTEPGTKDPERSRNHPSIQPAANCTGRSGQRRISTASNATCGIRKIRSEEHTSELQSRFDLVCRLLLE